MLARVAGALATSSLLERLTAIGKMIASPIAAAAMRRDRCDFVAAPAPSSMDAEGSTSCVVGGMLAVVLGMLTG
jgi:hypothetical protein